MLLARSHLATGAHRMALAVLSAAPPPLAEEPEDDDQVLCIKLARLPKEQTRPARMRLDPGNG
jgi:hypothetical protein